MKRIFSRFFLLAMLTAFAGLALTGCDNPGSEDAEEHAVVESGTYEGTVGEVNPDEKEIYVNHDDKELELYFTDTTQLTRDGEAVEFSALQKGQRVEVEVKKVGKRLDPVSVKILE